VSDAEPDAAADREQIRPKDHNPSAGPTPTGGDGPRPVRQFRMSRRDRVGDAICGALARVGIGPFHLLTTRGRRTGLPRSKPVVLVIQDEQRWLVAPYGPVSWVLNARAAGRVTLRRGRERREYAIDELPAAAAGPILKRYLGVASATRPYFRASKDSPVEDFVAEADRHPVFKLTPIADDRS